MAGGGASETFIFGRGHVANRNGGHLGSMGWSQGQGPMLGGSHLGELGGGHKGEGGAFLVSCGEGSHVSQGPGGVGEGGEWHVGPIEGGTWGWGNF